MSLVDVGTVTGVPPSVRLATFTDPVAPVASAVQLDATVAGPQGGQHSQVVDGGRARDLLGRGSDIDRGGPHRARSPM